MKLKLALLSSLVALGGSVQAADTSAPDMLSSVSPESVQAMSNAESAGARGEYRYIQPNGRTGRFASKNRYEIGQFFGSALITHRSSRASGTYVSR